MIFFCLPLICPSWFSEVQFVNPLVHCPPGFQWTSVLVTKGGFSTLYEVSCDFFMFSHLLFSICFRLLWRIVLSGIFSLCRLFLLWSSKNWNPTTNYFFLLLLFLRILLSTVLNFQVSAEQGNTSITGWNMNDLFNKIFCRAYRELSCFNTHRPPPTSMSLFL